MAADGEAERAKGQQGPSGGATLEAVGQPQRVGLGAASDAALLRCGTGRNMRLQLESWLWLSLSLW